MNRNRHQLEGMRMHIWSWLSSKVGRAGKPNGDSQRRGVGLRRPSRTYGLIRCVVAMVLLLCLTLYFHASNAEASGCYTKKYLVSVPNYFYVDGYCSSSADAHQGCDNFTNELGHSTSYCWPRSALLWGAGWITEAGVEPGKPPYPPYYWLSFYYPEFYVSASPEPSAECGSGCNQIGDPVNPINGSVSAYNQDLSSFSRFYNSVAIQGSGIGSGWSSQYSRRISVRLSGVTYRPYSADTSNSPKYNDEASACASGFLSIRNRVSSWSEAKATYNNGTCSVTSGGVFLGSLQIYATIDAPFDSVVAVSFDVTRDNGRLIRFTMVGGVITGPPGISLQLMQTASGFTVTDANDNVEQYDTSGKLLSITSRADVVQTMSYDTSGRLSGVSDNFGHQLTLSYDAQDRLISVTRQ